MSAPTILTLNSPTIRNQRTLIWLHSQAEKEYWTKWDSVVTSLADYHRWYDLNARIVGMVLTEIQGDEEEWLTDLFEVSRDIQMIFLSRSILQRKSQEYWTENYDNVVSLDEITEPYPFLRLPWSNTVEDGVALFAFLCRYHRLIDCPVSDKRHETFGGAISVEKGIVPQETWLITQFFRSPQKKRFKEIKDCLERNAACSYLDRILLLNETDLSDLWRNLPGAEKITQIVTGKRLTYAHFLQFVHDEAPTNVYAILANADMYMGPSLLDLWKMNLADRVLALLRWDDPGDGGKPVLFGPRADSQDTWIMLSNSVKERTWSYATFDFPLGKVGCDNAFAAHLLRNHMSLFNPSMSFQTFHLHASNVRTYDKRDMIRSDLYVNLVPSYLIDIKQELIPGGAVQYICNELVQFEVRSSSLSNEITFCTMLEKEGRYKWTASEENQLFEPAIPVYRWKNACVTANGLVYDPYTLYKGKHAEDPRFNYWPDSQVDLYTPLQTAKKMLAIPFASTDVFLHPDTYVLEYMSRAARLLTEHPDATLWVPNEMAPHVALLSKISNRVTWEGNTACWADEVIGFLPGPLSVELGRENVSALRTMMPTWKGEPTPCQCTVVIDNTITTAFVKERILPLLKKQNSAWTIRTVSEHDHGQYAALLGSTLCLVLGGKNTKNKWAKLWALPVECVVIEFQQELEISGELQHLCHVSDVLSWVLLLSKGDQKDVQDQIIEQFEKWCKKNSYLLSA